MYVSVTPPPRIRTMSPSYIIIIGWWWNGLIVENLVGLQTNQQHNSDSNNYTKSDSDDWKQQSNKHRSEAMLCPNYSSTTLNGKAVAPTMPPLYFVDCQEVLSHPWS